MTVALQRDDLATRAEVPERRDGDAVNRERVGRDVRRARAAGQPEERSRRRASKPDTRIYDFTLTFDKGVVHETIKFDPDKKIVGFHYDPPTRT